MRVLQTVKKGIKGQAIVLSILCVILSVLLSTCTGSNNDQWTTMQDLLWENPDSCLIQAQLQLPNINNEYDSLIVSLIQEHAYLRINHDLDDPNKMIEIAGLLDNQYHDQRFAGEAYYLLGTHYLVAGDDYMATYYLKYAEEQLLAATPCDSMLLGIVYYRLGNVAAEERLFEFAQSYYRQSIDYLSNTDNALYLACAYRDAALTLPAEMSKGQKELLDSALFYTKTSGNSLMLQDIEYTISTITGADKNELLRQDKLLCDSFAQFSHAANLIPFYIEKRNLDSAYYYLQMLAEDTLSHIWSREQYYYQYAALLDAIGKKDSAIQVLQTLHIWQTQEIENDAFTRTYAIAQQFDLLKEQNKSLQLQIDKTRLYVICITMLAIMLIGLVISTCVFYRKRIVYQTTLSEKKQIQKTIQAQLQERLMLTKELNKAMLANKKEELPVWAQSYYSSLHLSIAEQDKIIENANLAFSNILDKIHQDNPQVSKSDMLLIALILLGFTIEDCCLLLNSTKEAIWKKRKRLRQRLTLEPDTNLDEWILEQQKKGRV